MSSLKVHVLCLYSNAGLEEIVGVFSERRLAERAMENHYKEFARPDKLYPNPNSYEIESWGLDE